MIIIVSSEGSGQISAYPFLGSDHIEYNKQKVHQTTFTDEQTTYLSTSESLVNIWQKLEIRYASWRFSSLLVYLGHAEYS